MSLQEKIDQMFQVMGLFFTEDEEGTLTGPAQNFGVDVKDLQSAGTILGCYGADTLKAIQDKAILLVHWFKVELETEIIVRSRLMPVERG